MTAPIHPIKAGNSFRQLSKKEQAYAYHMSRASWEGSKICWFERSYESPGLFFLLKNTFNDGLDQLKENSLAAGVTEDEWKQMCAYSAAVFQNCGNYKSFGDTKFVPEISPESFKKIVRSSKGYADSKDKIDGVLDIIEFEVFEEHEKFAHIGFRDENGGTTSYYSSNVTKDEADFIDKWCQELKISPLNTRLLKTSETEFELMITSLTTSDDKTPYMKKYEKDGKTMNVTGADFKVFMEPVV